MLSVMLYLPVAGSVSVLYLVSMFIELYLRAREALPSPGLFTKLCMYMCGRLEM